MVFVIFPGIGCFSSSVPPAASFFSVAATSSTRALVGASLALSALSATPALSLLTPALRDAINAHTLDVSHTSPSLRTYMHIICAYYIYMYILHIHIFNVYTHIPRRCRSPQAESAVAAPWQTAPRYLSSLPLHICVHIILCVRIHTYIMHVCMYVYKYMSEYKYLYACMYVYTYIHTYIHTHIYMYIIYMYIHTHTHKHTHTHTCVCVCVYIYPGSPGLRHAATGSYIPR
jgi:hypothetical protein